MPFGALHRAGNLHAGEHSAVLIGGTVTGKTHLAIAIAGAAICNGARGRFFKGQR